MSIFGALPLPDELSVGRMIQAAAGYRWLNPLELTALLLFPNTIGIRTGTFLPYHPEAGSLFVLQTTKYLKDDGYEWKRKRNRHSLEASTTLQECHRKFNVFGNKLILAVYISHKDDETFQRRIYRLLGIPSGSFYYQISHYLYDLHGETTPTSRQEGSEVSDDDAVVHNDSGTGFTNLYEFKLVSMICDYILGRVPFPLDPHPFICIPRLPQSIAALYAPNEPPMLPNFIIPCRDQVTFSATDTEFFASAAVQELIDEL